MNSEINTAAATPAAVAPKPNAPVLTNVNVTTSTPAKTRQQRSAKKQAAPAAASAAKL